ncbi:hypothetical protein K1719_042674 [Acacia pycnantha]|nr:hypothetical protein K1719_042674 [Acacia pycnantha]
MIFSNSDMDKSEIVIIKKEGKTGTEGGMILHASSARYYARTSNEPTRFKISGGTPIPSPSTTLTNRRTPMAHTFQSPMSPFFLGSNDDQLERAQSSAARAASTLRNVAAPPPQADSGLSSDQIVELFRNCIKLASENKITQKNSWQLKLIDHLSEIIKVDAENAQPNFQKASCTLEAGVKIYSARVDAVHSEAYKFLTRMKQAGVE